MPLTVNIGTKDKKFILNLNQYRNLHYRTLAQAKVNYSQDVYRHLAEKEPPEITTAPLTIHYDYYHGSRRRHDVLNPISIIDKFGMDALVNWGLLPDDNIDIVKQYVITSRGVDKENPRASLRITKYE